MPANPSAQSPLTDAQLAGFACIACAAEGNAMVPVYVETTTSTMVFRCTSCECDIDRAEQLVMESDPTLVALRAIMEREEDVRRVVRLVRQGDRFRYLIETPFATFPQAVIGTTDQSFARVRHEVKCSSVDAANDVWRKNPAEL